MACCCDGPTLETLAAVAILRQHLPGLKARVLNVVDLNCSLRPSILPVAVVGYRHPAALKRDRELELSWRIGLMA